jgi:hypothetical protein
MNGTSGTARLPTTPMGIAVLAVKVAELFVIARGSRVANAEGDAQLARAVLDAAREFDRDATRTD